MKTRLSTTLATCLLAACTFATAAAMAQPAPSAAASRAQAREIKWEDLMPKDWDPSKDLRELGKGYVADGSPEAQKRMNDIRKVWDEAPTVASLDGQAIKLPGYVVPLEEGKEG
ncbi:MAG TPA: DUF3299 domain-containing protein, partial [Rhizobacter sp.]